jgi:hypothetical protein
VNAPFAIFPEGALGRRKTRAVVALFERSVRHGWRSRLGQIYSYAAALGAGFAAVYLSRHGGNEAVRSLFARALELISWASGAVALWAARDRESEEQASGVLDLARLHGVDARERAVARACAVATVLARSVGGSGLVLASFAVLVAHSGRDVAGGLAFGVGVLGYGVAYGLLVSAVVEISRVATVRHATWVALAIVFLPYLASEGGSAVPNVVTALSWLIERVTSLGAPS